MVSLSLYATSGSGLPNDVQYKVSSGLRIHIHLYVTYGLFNVIQYRVSVFIYIFIYLYTSLYDLWFP